MPALRVSRSTGKNWVKTALAFVPVPADPGPSGQLGQGGGPFLDVFAFHQVPVFPGLLDVLIFLQGQLQGLFQGKDQFLILVFFG